MVPLVMRVRVLVMDLVRRQLLPMLRMYRREPLVMVRIRPCILPPLTLRRGRLLLPCKLSCRR